MPQAQPPYGKMVIGYWWRNLQLKGSWWNTVVTDDRSQQGNQSLVPSEAILTALLGMYSVWCPFLLLLRRNWRIGQSSLYIALKNLSNLGQEKFLYMQSNYMAIFSSAGRYSSSSVQILRIYKGLKQRWTTYT